MVRKILLALSCVAVFSLAACRTAPPVSPSATLDTPVGKAKMERAIKLGAASKGWETKTVKPGLIVATYKKDIHTASVNVSYDERSWKISKNDDTNMYLGDSKDRNEVNRKFNQWVRNLDKAIRQEAYKAEFDAQK